MNPKPPLSPRASPAAPASPPQPVQAATPGELDIPLFREGTHARLYKQLSCHLVGQTAYFAVWAPNAQAVSVIGDFNAWRAGPTPARPRWDRSGI